MADIDDMQHQRLLDYAYGELTAADAAAFERELEAEPRLKAELDALERTRAAAQSAMPDVEPPAAIANMLLHEAAKQARGAQADQPGLWDRLLGWFQPLIAHPGLSAAAALVLFVAVVGTVGLSRVSQEAAQAPGEAAGAALDDSGDEPVAAAPGVANEDAARKATPFATKESPQEAEQEAEQDAEHDAEQDAENAPDALGGAEAGLLDGSLSESGSAAGKGDARRTAELADAKQETRLRRAERGQKRQTAPEAKKKARPRKRRSSRGASSDPLAPLPKSDDSANRYGGRSGGVGKAAPAKGEADSDSVFADEAPPARSKAPPPAAPQGPARAAPRPSQQRTPEPAPAAVPAGGGALDDAEVAPQAEAEVAAPPPARSQRRVRSEQVFAQLRVVARTLKNASQRCREVARLANDIRDRDPSFYKKNVATHAAVRGCNRAVVAETARRARRRRARQSDSKATATEAGEANETSGQD